MPAYADNRLRERIYAFSRRFAKEIAKTKEAAAQNKNPAAEHRSAAGRKNIPECIYGRTGTL
jgi:hypothetical protein